MKYKVFSNSFAEEERPKIDAFEDIIVNATTLKALLEAADGPITLTLSDEETIAVWHPYDF